MFFIKWQFYPLLQELTYPLATLKRAVSGLEFVVCCFTLFNSFHALPRRYRRVANKRPALTGKFQKWH